MELTQEQKKETASNVIIELIQCGINRGAYSSIEVQAIKTALSIITTPTDTPKQSVEQPEKGVVRNIKPKKG